MGVCLPAGSMKQLLTLTNTAGVPLEFAWQYGVFEEQRAVMSGRLSVLPATGARQSCAANAASMHWFHLGCTVTSLI